MALALSRRNFQKVIATDFSTASMKHLREIDEEIYLCSEREFLEDSNYFDLLCSVDVFEHLSDPVGVLRNISSKAKSGGMVFISLPNLDSVFSKVHLGNHPYFAFPAHLNYFTKRSLQALVKIVGLELIRVQATTLPWEFEYIAKKFPMEQLNITGRSLWDLMYDDIQGERLFLLARKP